MTAVDQSFTATGLTCVRGNRVVFADLSFALMAGEAMLLRGPNGSGKSSLLRLVAGLLPPAQGTLRWHDGEVRTIAETHRARIAFVGHQEAVKPVLSVAENLAFWAGLSNHPEAVTVALERTGLSDLAAAPAALLSSGQRRRLALARLHLGPKGLWLLDEPSVGLDSKSLADLESAIKKHRIAGGMALIATHTEIDTGDARRLNLADFTPDPSSNPLAALI